jgi:hypothetical protein
VVVEKMNLNEAMEYSGIQKTKEMVEYSVVDNLNELEVAFVVADMEKYPLLIYFLKNKNYRNMRL